MMSMQPNLISRVSIICCMPTPLPKLGKPATRALEARGITTVEQLVKLTEEELLAIHGVGPKAIAILAAAGVKLR